MLALREMQIPPLPGELSVGAQLPSEVLDHIAGLLYNGSFQQLDTLFPFSLVNRQYRKSALHYLFGTVSHFVHGRPAQQHSLLRRLLSSPRLLGYVHTLHLLRPLDLQEYVHPVDRQAAKELAHEHSLLAIQAVHEALPHMLRLRRIRFDCSTTSAHHMVEQLPSDKRYEIVLDHVYTTFSKGNLLHAPTEVADKFPQHDFALGALDPRFQMDPSARQATYNTLSRAVAVSFHTAWSFRSNGTSSANAHNSNPFAPGFQSNVSWRELRLVVDNGHGHPRLWLPAMNTPVLLWTRLLRLSITWNHNVPMNDFVHQIVPMLVNLQALHLHADHQRIYHPACSHEEGPNRIFRDPPECRPFAIEFGHLPRLDELKIDGICNHIPIKHLVGPNLRVFRLHREDSLFSVYSIESQRTAKDVVTLTKLAPRLEYLELDVGYIETLWHPVGIIGVDVDDKQYAFLDTLSRFKHLKFLRLFPPFVARFSPRDSRSLYHRLPVADDQAVRIFEYLHNKCPSLQLLSIAAIPSFLNVDTMFWEVRRQGDNILLTTGHRMRNYRHRQTWVGQRKIRSEIKRFSVPRPYLPESDAWILTRDDRLPLYTSNLYHSTE